MLHRLGGIGADRQESASAERKTGQPPRNESPGRLPLVALAWRQFRRVPATIVFLAAIWGAGLATGSITHGPARRLAGHSGAGLAAVAHHHWWTPLGADLLASGLGSYLAATVLCLLILAPAENRMGAVRTFATLLASQTIGLVLAAGLIKLAEPTRGSWLSALSREAGVGFLPGVLGVGFALSCTLTPRWRRRLQLLLVVTITINAIYVGHLEQVVQACGAASGLIIAALTYKRVRPWAGRAVSQREMRTLVGILVAVPALGEMLAALIPNAHGPRSLFSFLSSAQGPESRHLAAICSHPELAVACRGLREQHFAYLWLGVFVQAVPALLLLLSAYWLRRGRRLAWWLAIAINVTVLAVSAWTLVAVSSAARLDARAPATTGEAMLLAVVTVIVLLVTRRHFNQTAERRAVRKLTATLAIALGASGGAFLLLGYILRDEFSPRSAFGVPTRDLPMGFLTDMLFNDRSLPQDADGRVLYAGVFLLLWVVVLGALTVFFLHSSTYREPGSADRARALLMRGGSTVSYMSTWSGNKYWFSSDGRAAIAYRAIGAVAVTVGEPYGDPAALDSAITEFAGFCENRSLQPCLYGVTARTRAATERLGWTSVQVAEDTVLPLRDLDFAGKKWLNVRNAMNKAAREGITAEWYSYPEAPLDLAEQIRQISERWVADKGLPEMGFTLGGLAELNDPNVRCLIAVGADRTVQAITSWLPVYESGRPVGWTLDWMRRNTGPGTPHGVMEFLIASAARTFRQEGARFISLAGAPLARLDRGEQPCPVQRLLDMVANAMEPMYGFQSLLKFKDKFHPDYQPLYLTYPEPAAIGSIAAAIGRAYLPDLTSWQALRLLTKVRWAHTGRGPAAASRATRDPVAT